MTAGHDTCRSSRAIPEHALTGHMIIAHEGRTLDSCVVTCEQVQNCFSINYFSTIKRCELNNKSAEWHFSDLQPMQSALYLAMIIRIYTPCVDLNPPCLGTCVPVPGSLATQCVCEGHEACQNDCKCCYYCLCSFAMCFYSLNNCTRKRKREKVSKYHIPLNKNK